MMSPQRRGILAYWHSGGAIESRSGPIAARRAVELFAFYVREALAGFERGDAGAATHCARCSLEIAAAIGECEGWRRSTNAAADGRATHEFSRLWLSEAYIVKKLLNILDRLELS
jgi:hypothetical protein